MTESESSYYIVLYCGLLVTGVISVLIGVVAIYFCSKVKLPRIYSTTDNKPFIPLKNGKNIQNDEDGEIVDLFY
jgi:hypothetical protein